MSLPPYATAIQERLLSFTRMHQEFSPSRRAAVVLPILANQPSPKPVLVQRKEHGQHGGQFAFPGGVRDASDASDWHCALREMQEETGLKHEVRHLGTLGEYNTYVSSFRVCVEVGYLAKPQEWIAEEGEIQCILEVPRYHLEQLFQQLPSVDDARQLPIENGFEFNPEEYVVKGDLRAKGKGHQVKKSDKPEEMPLIWGLAARILYDFFREVWQPE